MALFGTELKTAIDAAKKGGAIVDELKDRFQGYEAFCKKLDDMHQIVVKAGPLLDAVQKFITSPGRAAKPSVTDVTALLKLQSEFLGKSNVLKSPMETFVRTATKLETAVAKDGKKKALAEPVRVLAGRITYALFQNNYFYEDIKKHLVESLHRAPAQDGSSSSAKEEEEEDLYQTRSDQ